MVRRWPLAPLSSQLFAVYQTAVYALTINRDTSLTRGFYIQHHTFTSRTPRGHGVLTYTVIAGVRAHATPTGQLFSEPFRSSYSLFILPIMAEQTLNIPQLLVFIIVSVLAVRWYL